MIREEQYDDDYDEDSDNEYKQKQYYDYDKGGIKENNKGQHLEENYSLDSL